MDLYDVATYFDEIPVLDGYSNQELFICQMDVYDATERDSMTGFRRSCSAGTVSLPTRRVVKIQDEYYIVGRKILDYFKDRKIREHLLLHPADGLFSHGTALKHITNTGLSTLYAAVALRKEGKEEGESSEFFAMYNIYMGNNEEIPRDHIVKSPDGHYYRVQAFEQQTGEYHSAYVSDLGKNALTTVIYTPAGEYDVAADAHIAGTPVTLTAFVERYQTNYRYLTWSAAKFQNGDIVVTISATTVANPKTDARFLVRGRDYRMIEKQQDGFGCWELQLRPADFNLVVET